jgi:hypothetical protein
MATNTTSVKDVGVSWNVYMKLDDFSRSELDRVFTVKHINQLLAFIDHNTPFPDHVESDGILCIIIIATEYEQGHASELKKLIQRKLGYHNDDQFMVLSRELKMVKAEEQKYLENLSALIEAHAATGDTSIIVNSKKFRSKEIQAKINDLVSENAIIDLQISQIGDFMRSQRIQNFTRMGKILRSLRIKYDESVKIVVELAKFVQYEQKLQTEKNELNKAFEKCLTAAKDLYFASLKGDVEWSEKIHQKALAIQSIS